MINGNVDWSSLICPGHAGLIRPPAACRALLPTALRRPRPSCAPEGSRTKEALGLAVLVQGMGEEKKTSKTINKTLKTIQKPSKNQGFPHQLLLIGACFMATTSSQPGGTSFEASSSCSKAFCEASSALLGDGSPPLSP